jgi:hypothetical protein
VSTGSAAMVDVCAGLLGVVRTNSAEGSACGGAGAALAVEGAETAGGPSGGGALSREQAGESEMAMRAPSSKGRGARREVMTLQRIPKLGTMARALRVQQAEARDERIGTSAGVFRPRFNSQGHGCDGRAYRCIERHIREASQGRPCHVSRVLKKAPCHRQRPCPSGSLASEGAKTPRKWGSSHRFRSTDPRGEARSGSSCPRNQP